MFSQLGINRIREKDISLCMYNGASPEAFGEILNSFPHKKTSRTIIKFTLVLHCLKKYYSTIRGREKLS